MKLSKRLEAIFQMVPQGSIIADIGCDHGFLPITLVQEKICSKAYACDLREKPLHKAIKMIEKCQLQEQVIPLLRNGIENLPDDVDTIVIAGMGFETIKMILENNLSILPKYKRWIIQSNTDVEQLRYWLYQHNGFILDEDIVYEGHYYQILSFSFYEGKKLTEDDCLFGINLYQHPLFKPMWKYHLDKLHHILEQIPKTNKSYEEIHNYKNRIEEIL